MFRHAQIGSAMILLALVSVFGDNCTTTKPCTLKGGDVFRKPSEQKSANGELQTAIEVAASSFTLDWLTTTRRLYNSSFPGPTLKIKPGDLVKLQLINSLQEPDFRTDEHNILKNPNTTNLHTHGLHVSSQEPQDNVLVEIKPDGDYQFAYEIHPDHPPGTYWYHPHFHGSGYFQNLGGMAGMLIVEDSPSSMSAELDAASCPNQCENDIPVVLQLFQYSTADDGSYSVAQQDIHDNEAFRLNNIMLDNDTQTLEEWLEDPANDVQHMLVNGQLKPVLTLATGTTFRFRLLNAGGVYAVALKVVNAQTQADETPCSVYEIALDGHYLDKPRLLSNGGRSFLVAAARVDWLLHCSKPGSYEIVSQFYESDKSSLGEHPSYGGSLLSLEVSGTAAGSVPFVPESLPPRPSFEDDLRKVDDAEFCGNKFAVEVTPTDSLNRVDYSNSIRYKAKLGTYQEWYLTNTEYLTSHPIHIHVNAFQVIGYNEYTGPYGVDDGDGNWKLFNQKDETCTFQHPNYNQNVAISPPVDALGFIGHENRLNQNGSLGYAQIGEWRDTLLVPPLSNITIRFRTDSYSGIVLVHCHLLSDADLGMSMLTEIVDADSSTEANITAGGAYPWSCMDNSPVPVNVECGSSSQRARLEFIIALLIVALVKTSDLFV